MCACVVLVVDIYVIFFACLVIPAGGPRATASGARASCWPA
jgi:hypothetical protein